MTLAFFRRLLLLSLVALVARTASAQGTSLVPPTDLAYRDVDRLSELGVLDSLIIGQRPYSRREMGRIVRVARERLDRADFIGRGELAARGGQFSDDVLIQASAILQRLAGRFPTRRRSGRSTARPWRCSMASLSASSLPTRFRDHSSGSSPRRFRRC